jgi:molybdopterin molybdotransferase/putative molybdopterin biosynthesis protein
VRAADFADTVADTSAWREGVDYVIADTGDDFDDRFDAVVPVEFVRFIPGGGIELLPGAYEIKPGSLVEPRGGTVAEGQPLVRPGARISSIGLANLLTGGVESVDLAAKPMVSFVPTGSELVKAGIRPSRGQVVDCNSAMVAALLSEWGAAPRLLPIVRDVPADLGAVLDEAIASSDIVLVGGGSSKGREDFCPRLIRDRAQFFIHYAKARPGRPIVASLCGGKPVIDIPGTAFSTFVPMQWCVRPLVEHWFGLDVPRPVLRARMLDDLVLREEYPLAYGMFFHVERECGTLTARSLDKFGSRGELFMEANAYAILPIGCGGFRAGDELDLYPIA